MDSGSRRSVLTQGDTSIGDIETGTSTTTATFISGSNIAQYINKVFQSSQDAKLRRRHRNWKSETGNRHCESMDIFEYFEKRREETRKDYCLLVCWASSQANLMTDISIEDPNDECAVFEAMRHIYYNRRGRWRRVLALVGVTILQKVEVSEYKETLSKIRR